MRKLPSITESSSPRSGAFASLQENAGLPEEVDFSNSFVEAPAAGSPGSAVAASRSLTRSLARDLKPEARDAMNVAAPRMEGLPDIMPRDAAEPRQITSVSRLPDSVLQQIQPDSLHEFTSRGMLDSQAFQDAPAAVRNKTLEAFDKAVKEEEADLDAKQPYRLTDVLQRDDVQEKFPGFRLPAPTPTPSDVFGQVLGANPAAFQMPSLPNGSPGFGGMTGSGPIPGFAGPVGSSGSDFARNSQDAKTILGAGMDAGFGTANSAQLASQLANLLPPEAAQVVQQAIVMGQSFANVAENGLNPSNAADMVGQIGDALGIPGLGQAAGIAKQMFDHPGGLEGALNDPAALAQIGMAQLMSFLPPMAQAAIAQAQAIAGALKELMASPPGIVAPGTPGVFVEQQMIATVLTAQTTHGIPLMPGPGCITVHALMMPVWRVGMDVHICPIPIPIPPHGPGIVPIGALRTFAEFGPIARHGDMVLEVVPSTIIPMPIAGGSDEDDSDDSSDDSNDNGSADGGDSGNLDEAQEPDDADSNSSAEDQSNTDGAAPHSGNATDDNNPDSNSQKPAGTGEGTAPPPDGGPTAAPSNSNAPPLKEGEKDVLRQDVDKNYPGPHQKANNCGIQASNQVISDAKGNATPYDEDKFMNDAIKNGQADDNANPLLKGISTDEQRQELLKANGVDSTLQANTKDNLSNAIKNNQGIVAGVNIEQLPGGMQEGGQRGGHAVVVTGGRFDANGNLTGVYVNDTGDGNPGPNRYYNADDFVNASKQPSGSNYSDHRLNVTTKPIPTKAPQK